MPRYIPGVRSLPLKRLCVSGLLVRSLIPNANYHNMDILPNNMVSELW